MKQTEKVIPFPGTETRKRGRKGTRVLNMDGIKYFNAQQIKLLRRTVRDRAELDEARGKVSAVREWMALDLLTSTGLRVGEAADIRCGDIRAGYGQSGVFVRKGKGSRSRTVEIPESLKKHLKHFLKWKQDHGEPVGPDDHLFLGQRGAWTSQAIQQVVKKYLKGAGALRKREIGARPAAFLRPGVLPAGEGPQGPAEAAGARLCTDHSDLCARHPRGHPGADPRPLGPERGEVNHEDR